VVTFMPTCQVIDRAVELGANLVIAHEPTFYNGTDKTGWLDGDSTYLAKSDLLRKHGITIWRYHDGSHRQKPDSILAGLIGKMGWHFDAGSARENIFTVPPSSLRDLARLCKERLGIEMVRIAGDPDMNCARIGILVGAWGGEAQIRLLKETDVDVVICGESPEWETCEYVRDATYLGRKRGLIVLGHANSEEPGMEWVAHWLRGLLPGDIPVTHVPAGDPFRYI
jgi:putative NIF3 family GTP cyclohydrolase 1 type 2